MAKAAVLIQNAKMGETLLNPFSELQIIENLLKSTTNSSASRNAMKLAAYKAAEIFGTGWTHKSPLESKDVAIRDLLHKMVIDSTPAGHPNKDMRWNRFQQYGSAIFLDRELRTF